MVNSLLLTLTVLIEALVTGLVGNSGNGSGSGGGAPGKSVTAADFKSKCGVDETAYAAYTQDVVSYVISTGVVDKLNVILFQVTLDRANNSANTVSNSANSGASGDEGAVASVDAELGEYLARILGFLTALTQLLMLRVDKEKKHEGMRALKGIMFGTGTVALEIFRW